MFKIHFLSLKDPKNSQSVRYPLLANRDRLLEKGIDFEVFYELTDRIKECDLICVDSKYFKGYWGSRTSKIFENLNNLSHRNREVLWFDTTDSTGTTQFGVLPHVDGYYKGQLLKDRTLYTKKFYGHRIFTDFYHEEFGVEDDDDSVDFQTANSDQLDKLFVSWNTSLADHGRKSWFSKFLQKIGLINSWSYRHTFKSPDSSRPREINARFTTDYGRETIAYQRTTIQQKLEDEYDLSTERISRSDYLKELSRTRAVVSPFGWGEICYRDYEAFLNGCALVKPDMNHLETWPPLYEDEVTYEPVSWNLSDLEDKLEKVLTDEHYLQLANNAQERYRYYLKDPGRKEFCDRFEGIINRHLS